MLSLFCTTPTLLFRVVVRIIVVEKVQTKSKKPMNKAFALRHNQPHLKVNEPAVISPLTSKNIVKNGHDGCIVV